jgi:hypothetical protein
VNANDQAIIASLSTQDTCNCAAAPGQRHAEECQYIADLLAWEAEKASRRFTR